MAVTSDSIRALLGQPQGLLTATIDEYIDMRTNYVNKVARDDTYLVNDTYAVTSTLKDDAVKMLVAVDCLTVLIDTLPTHFANHEDARFYDRRFQYQLDQFQKRAKEALSLVEEKGGRAFVVKSTDTRIVE